jgi:hypothetical protein
LLHHPATKWAKRTVLPALRWAIALGLLAYVLFTLQSLGWSTVWQAMPTQWTFYVVVIVLFFVQPICDLVIYRRLWRIHPALGLAVMLRKRFFNTIVIDYSGEAWLYGWARQQMPGRDAFILHSIKDNNILSAVAAMVVMILLFVGLLLAVPRQVTLSAGQIAATVALATLMVLPITGYLLARRHVTTLPASELFFAFAIHLIRSALNNGLAALAWSQGMPGVPLLSLCELLALRLLVSRVPLLGNKDLLLLGTGLGLAGAIDLPQTNVAAVLLAVFVIDHLFNMLGVGLPMLLAALGDLLRRRAQR